ncbi:carotenoid biosynthesis protein [Metabacillus lacus]|uniref:carotenoid biosynthesis protein n=1 Tax=Metabacillus lacus TaxID=1983721 RepID=UPI0014786832|nr:carotenoid biosynthesis protein [Metabacillus lacus]
MKKFFNGCFYFFLVWYACGVILLSFDILPPWLEWANAVFLMAAGLLGGAYFIMSYGLLKGLLLSLGVIFGSIFAEHVGVKYGIIFGDYYYTKDFGPQMIGVPAAIGFAWLMIIAASHSITKTLFPQRTLFYLLPASLITVLIDLIIDPVAFEVKKYWIWEEGSSFYYNIPFSNFLGWFIVAFLLHTMIYLSVKKEWKQENIWDRRIVIVYFLVMGMFLLLAAIHGLWMAVAFTAVPAALVLYLYYKKLEKVHHDYSKQKALV